MDLGEVLRPYFGVVTAFEFRLHEVPPLADFGVFLRGRPGLAVLVAAWGEPERHAEAVARLRALGPRSSS